MPQPDQALKMYKKAHLKGNLDATINMACWYLEGKFAPADKKVGKALLMKAHSQKSAKAADWLVHYGLVKSK